MNIITKIVEMILFYKKDENNPEYYKIDLKEC